MARLILVFTIFLIGCAPSPRADDFVKEFNSVYGHIIVRQTGTVVEMFATYRGWTARESGIDLADPTRIIVPYVKYLFAGSLVRPDPQSVLVIGLGGGGFNRLFNETYPDAILTSIEIDGKVLELAKDYMGFTESDNNRVVIRDGRAFIRRSTEKFDWIILDAFHGSVVPPHLKTQEFYRDAAAKLNPGGVLIANIHDDSELFFYDLVTFRAAFSDVLMLKVPNTGNVIVLAGDFPAGTLETRLTEFDASTVESPIWQREISPAGFAKSIIRFTESDFERGRVMTDDFAPAEYYKIIPAAPRR